MILIPFYQSKLHDVYNKLVAKHERVVSITTLVVNTFDANYHLREFASAHRIDLSTPFDKGPADLGIPELPPHDANFVKLGVRGGPMYVDGGTFEVLQAAAKNVIEYKIVITKPTWEDKPVVHKYAFKFDESQDDAAIAAKLITALATIAQEITK